VREAAPFTARRISPYLSVQFVEDRVDQGTRDTVSTELLLDVAHEVLSDSNVVIDTVWL